MHSERLLFVTERRALTDCLYEVFEQLGRKLYDLRPIAGV